MERNGTQWNAMERNGTQWNAMERNCERDLLLRGELEAVVRLFEPALEVC
jgi:hypothetical protein